MATLGQPLQLSYLLLPTLSFRHSKCAMVTRYGDDSIRISRLSDPSGQVNSSLAALIFQDEDHCKRNQIWTYPFLTISSLYKPLAPTSSQYYNGDNYTIWLFHSSSSSSSFSCLLLFPCPRTFCSFSSASSLSSSSSFFSDLCPLTMSSWSSSSS